MRTLPFILLLSLIVIALPRVSNGDAPKGEKSKSIDFDSEVVEGMNKNPLDSLTRVGKKDDKQQGHLYRRKGHFKREIRQTVQEMGYTQ
jgi:hypothetical protein